MIDNDFKRSLDLGLSIVALTKNLDSDALLVLRKSELANKRKSFHIAQSIFNRMPPSYDFETNFNRLMQETKGLLFVNKNTITLSTVLQSYKPRIDQFNVAYFRYADGSTMRLVNSVVHYVAPCKICTDLQKCKHGIEDLNL